MPLFLSFLRSLTALTPRATRLLAVGLLPIFAALLFLLYAHYAPPSFPYGVLWLSRSFAFWVDSIGVSLLLLLGGVLTISAAEKEEKNQ